MEGTEEVTPTLVIHNAALGPENRGATSLWVKKDEQEFLIATLSGEHSFASLNIYLFIDDNSELFVKGPGSIHLIGTFSNEELPPGFEGLGENEDS